MNQKNYEGERYVIIDSTYPKRRWIVIDMLTMKRLHTYILRSDAEKFIEGILNGNNNTLLDYESTDRFVLDHLIGLDIVEKLIAITSPDYVARMLKELDYTSDQLTVLGFEVD